MPIGTIERNNFAVSLLTQPGWLAAGIRPELGPESDRHNDERRPSGKPGPGWERSRPAMRGGPGLFDSRGSGELPQLDDPGRLQDVEVQQI